MGSPISQVAQGYARLASELVTRWGDQAAATATKVQAGNYRADDAVNDLATWAFIAGESAVLIVSEAVDAIAILSGRQGEPYTVDSDDYASPLPGATLRLAGALTEGFGDSIPVSAVTILPSSTLHPGETRFSLRADVTGRRAGIYRGQVQATDPGGATAGVEVKLQVA
jgi:hypothetical protein